MSLLDIFRNTLKRTEPCTSNAGNCRTDVKDLGPIIKSPLDRKRYKAFELDNGIKAVIVSTCTHEFESDNDQCLQNEIRNFNKEHMGIDSYNNVPSSKPRKPSNTKAPPKGKGSNVIAGDSDLNFTPPCFPQLTDGTTEPLPAKIPRVIKCCHSLATACITIGVGSFHDPAEMDGLAHLMEHSVFLGSSNFREPNKMFTEAFANEGITNATTFSEQTIFFFSCTPSKLESCLEILIDGIANPLLMEDVIRKEIRALDSEIGIKQICDFTRMTNFLQSRAKIKHPLRKFYWGNKATLEHPNLIEVLKEWKSRYYIPSNMTVCIQAPFSLCHIQDITSKLFSKMCYSFAPTCSPKEEIAKLGAPFQDCNFNTKYYLAPISHMSKLVMTWCLPADYWLDYETQPIKFVGALIGSTSNGGLPCYLKSRNWITGLDNCFPAPILPDSSSCSFFGITIDLTDKGYEERDRVIHAVFSYIQLLKRTSCQTKHDCFIKMQHTAANSFHFKDWDGNFISSCKDIAVALQRVPPRHVLTSQKLITKFCPNRVNNLLELLTPERANFLLISNKNCDDCKKYSTWKYNIKFYKEDITDQEYKSLQKVRSYPEFFMPPPNTFLAREIILDDPLVNLAETYKWKTNIFENDKLIIQYPGEKKPPCFPQRVQVAGYSVKFVSTSAIPRINEGILHLWSNFINDKFKQLIGHQFDALFEGWAHISDECLSASVTGPRCHLVDFLTLFMKAIFIEDFMDETYFNNFRREVIREYTNNIYDIEELSSDTLKFILFNSHKSVFQKRNSLRDISLDEFQRLLKVYKARIKILVELDGSVLNDDFQRIVKLFGQLQYNNTCLIPQLPGRCTIIPLGCSILVLDAKHPAYVSSVITNYYQLESRDQTTANYYDLLFHAMRRTACDQLRTREQLGYTVSFKRMMGDHGTAGFKITVISHPEHFNEEHVSKRIDAFLENFYSTYLKSEETLQNRFSRFLRRMKPPLVFKDFKQYYADHLLESGKKIRKLSILVCGNEPDYRISKKERHEVNKNTGEQDDESDDVIQIKYRVNSNSSQTPVDRKGFRSIENIFEFKNSIHLAPAEEVEN